MTHTIKNIQLDRKMQTQEKDQQKDLKADLLEYIAERNSEANSTSHLTLSRMYLKHGSESFNTALDQYERQIPMLLNEYKENENLNYHSENYLLLANAFGTDEDIQKAKANLNFQRKNLYVDNDLSKAAHDACNPYYYTYLTQ